MSDAANLMMGKTSSASNSSIDSSMPSLKSMAQDALSPKKQLVANSAANSSTSGNVNILPITAFLTRNEA